MSKKLSSFYKEAHYLIKEVEVLIPCEIGLLGHSLPKQIRMINLSNHSTGIRNYALAVVIEHRRNWIEGDNKWQIKRKS